MIDRYRIDRKVSRALWHTRDLFYQLNGCIVTLAENGVSAVQMRRWHFSDKELRAVGIRARVGHGQATGAIKCEAGVEFILKAIARPANTLSQRIAALNHEAGNHPMKNGSVKQRTARLLAGFRISPFFGSGGQPDKVFYCLGRVGREELAREIAGRGVENSCGRLFGRGGLCAATWGCALGLG